MNQSDIEREAARLELAGEVARGASHDMRHILGIIKNYLRFLPTSAESAKDLEAINTAICQGEQLTGRLTQFGQIEPNDKHPLDLNTMVKDAVQIFVDEETTISFTTDLATGDPQIICNRIDLQQILFNLMLNARDAILAGVTHTGTVQILTTVEDTGVDLRINDNGIGMDERAQVKALKPFYTTKRSIGSGLGLTGAHRMILANHATLAIHSTPGKGTDLLIHFPSIP